MKEWLPAIVAISVAAASVALSQVLPSHSPAPLGKPEPRSDWLEQWVPRELGDWTAESRAISTDVLVTAGAGHYVARKYTNQTTAQAVDLLLIHGDPIRMHEHTSELCFPAAGYDRAGFARTGLVRVGPSVAGFAVTEFIGRGSNAPNRVTVWCGWRDDTGHWIPTLKRRQVAKVEDVWRLMASGHSLPVEAGGRQPEPCEAFLQVALPELEPIVAGVPPCPSPD